MSWVYENRASTVLYNLLKELKKENPEILFFIPSNVCPIVPATFCKVGVKYEFIDISIETLCIDLNIVKRKALEYSSIGLLYVRNLGIIHQNVDEVFRDLKKDNPDIFIIDDRCPCRIDFEEKMLCPNADVTLFSTGYAKYVEMGFGGCAFVNSPLQYHSNKLKYLKTDHDNLVDSFNYSIQNNKRFIYKESDWLDTNNPELGFEEYKIRVLSKRDEVDAHKAKLNNIYKNNLSTKVLPSLDLGVWRYNIFVKDKDVLLEDIFSNNLFASSHYSDISGVFNNVNSENSKALHQNIVNLFNDYRYSEEMAYQTCEIVNKHVKIFM